MFGIKKLFAVLLVGLIASYIYWPYHTIGKLEEAIGLADQQALEKFIDFPAVRASIKAQVRAKMTAMKADPATRPEMLAKLGPAATETMEKTVDSRFTSEQCAARFRAKRKAGASINQLRLTWTRLNVCAVKETNTEQVMSMTLTLKGLEGWRIVSIDFGDEL
jgi:hypothetical protein